MCKNKQARFFVLHEAAETAAAVRADLIYSILYRICVAFSIRRTRIWLYGVGRTDSNSTCTLT